MQLTIIIPLYNEESRIKLLIDRLEKYLSVSHFVPINFLLVNDGSKDATVEIAQKLIQNKKNITIVGYDQNRGKGAAVLFGMKMNKSDYVGFMDADIATPLWHIENIINIITNKKPDFIVGNRRSSPFVYRNVVRTFASSVFNIIAHLPLTRNYVDTQAGFKFYSKSFAEELIYLAKIENFSFDIEHLLIAEVLNIEVYIYSITDWLNGDNSKVRVMRDGAKMLRSCFTLFLTKKDYRNNYQLKLSIKE